MNIAILGTRGIPSGYSGYEAFAEELSVRLIERGHNITIYAHANMFVNRPEKYRGISIKYIPSLKGKNTSQFSHSLLSTIRAIFSHTDIVLFCNAANGPFGALLHLAKKKCAINVDGLEWMRPKWSNLAKRYFKFGAYTATKFFDVVITDAKGMQDYYWKEFRCRSVDIAYGANEKYSENPELVKQLGLTPFNYYLIASRLVPDNNADLIVKAFLQSNSKRILAIAGGTQYKNKFEEDLRKLSTNGRVKFLGHIDSSEVIKELHCNAYAYLHGHEFGGTNPALLKGLAYGNCILALDTVFNREVLKDGEYGILYAKNVDNLAQRISEIDSQSDVADNYRRKSRNRISENYTWEKITDQYEQLFLSMVNKS